jgi:CHAT domain-containing protein
LERARRAAPEDAAVLNDLAVAYLELGERDQQLMPMLRALDAIERAFERDSTHPAILFNRGLISQRLYLVDNAERAWRRYLAVENHPEWRAEAQAHARALRQKADTVSWTPFLRSPPARIESATRARISAHVRQSPQAAREFGFPLLGAWGTAFLDGDQARAAAFLTLAREIGGAGRSMELDRSLPLAVAAIDAAAGDPPRLDVLARGHVVLEEGRLLYEARHFRRAAEALHRSERLLRSVNTPAARWAAFYRAASEVSENRYEEGDRIFARIVSETGAYEPALGGKAIWALGLSQLRRGNYDGAIHQYREARPLIVKAGEAENEGAVAVLLAEALALAGREGEGSAEAHRALRILAPFRRSGFLNNHLAIVASIARDEGLSHAALGFTDELVGVARRIAKPTTLALALCSRARDLMSAGRPEAADAVLNEALRWADSIPGDRGGDRVRARVVLTLGQLTRQRDARAALPILAGAVDTYAGFKTDLLLPTALYEAATAARSAGDREKARRWLLRAIDYIDRQQGSFRGTETRATFYETVENVFDATIELELEEDRAEAAFQLLEHGRVQAWSGGRRGVDSAGTGPAPANLTRVKASLPDDMLFVEYAVLRDRLVIWTASRRGTRHYVIAVARDSVATLVDAFLRDAGAASPAGAARTRLFDLLIRPFAAELGGIRQLTVVPDRELNRLAFAALVDRGTGRYLVEGYTLRTVPSAGFYLAASPQTSGAAGGEGALVIGNPSLDDDPETGALPTLPSAAREAEIIARLYPGSVLLSSGHARRARVLDRLPGSSVFHFAGHAVFNQQQPEQSYLALAPDQPGRPGTLRAWEIGRLHLSNIEVVVLSACSSLSPRASRTGAVAGLAFSFLRAGAPATVSTLWDVDDGATMELVVHFHRLLAAGTPAPEALRQAQIAALRSTRPELWTPRAWAAFVYTGP